LWGQQDQLEISERAVEDDGKPEESDISSLSEQIIGLIFDQQFDTAAATIATALQGLSAIEAHRLVALSAVLQKERGNLRGSIDLMRQATAQNPRWLPHLYRLAVYLMDAEQWRDGSVVLDELISLSERKSDDYFLEEARIRMIICLKALGSEAEIAHHKARISPDAGALIGNRYIRLDDLD
jgi:hypothetical protein